MILNFTSTALASYIKDRNAIAKQHKLHIYKEGAAVITYFIDGPWALPSITDVNNNNIPDVIENTARAINIVRHIWHTLYGYQDPLNSQVFIESHGYRYRSIQVNFIPTSYNGKTYKTVAGSAHFSSHIKAADGNEHSLLLTFNQDKVASLNGQKIAALVAHEYFHLIQYGYIAITNGMYLEGMARWAQDLFSSLPHKLNPKMNFYKDGKCFDNSTYAFQIRPEDIIPLLENSTNLTNGINTQFTPNYISAIEAQLYSNAFCIFYPIAYLKRTDSDVLPDDVVNNGIAVDGTPFFKDKYLYGATAMKNFFSCMQLAQRKIMDKHGYTKAYDLFINLVNKSDENIPYIKSCLREVLH